MTEDSGRAMRLQQARGYLHNADPVLARPIDDRPAFDPQAWMARLPPMDLYGALLFQVTGQQLSVQATRRTLARIEALFDGHLPSPIELLGVEPGKLREAGLSWRKINTLRDLAERLSDGRLNQNVLSGLPDDELLAQLTEIPGIGHWTVQGALLIALHREDVGCRLASSGPWLAMPLIICTICLPSSRFSPSPRNGGRTAVWRPATCFPPRLIGPRHRRSSLAMPAERARADSRGGAVREPPAFLARWSTRRAIAATFALVGSAWPLQPGGRRHGGGGSRSGC